MKTEGSGNVTGLKFERRTRTQSRTRSPIKKLPNNDFITVFPLKGGSSLVKFTLIVVAVLTKTTAMYFRDASYNKT